MLRNNDSHSRLSCFSAFAMIDLETTVKGARNPHILPWSGRLHTHLTNSMGCKRRDVTRRLDVTTKQETHEMWPGHIFQPYESSTKLKSGLWKTCHLSFTRTDGFCRYPGKFTCIRSVASFSLPFFLFNVPISDLFISLACSVDSATLSHRLPFEQQGYSSMGVLICNPSPPTGLGGRLGPWPRPIESEQAAKIISPYQANQPMWESFRASITS